MSAFPVPVYGVAPSVLAALSPLRPVLPAAPLVPLVPFQLALARHRVRLAPEALLRRTVVKVVAQAVLLAPLVSLLLVPAHQMRILFAPVAHLLQIVLQYRPVHRPAIVNVLLVIAAIIWPRRVVAPLA